MPTAIEPGAVVDGKYRVIRRIGEGGMGTVYEGENVRIERRVAIKVLHEHVASSPEFAQRFEREARASARIGSPHVCDVLDLGDLPNGERFIVMEFLDGESLDERLAKGRLTSAQLAPIAFEILEGLGTMHQAGVIHRDLKPANVFLARGPRKAEVVKILDFGVAKIVPRADEPSDMTSTGMMMGTPLYMSPEQARGARDVDGRTDLYAASVIFYRALTGELPHSAANLHELLFKIVLEEPRPIRELAPDVDETFAAIVMKGLARDADQRYRSAREYQEEIAAWGAAQGRTSLQFTISLPSEPPPLRRSSGSFPAALVKAQPPITGPQSRPEKVGPPTPAVARTLGSDDAPPTKQSGGTPIVWSEDAPEVAKRALAELEAKKERQREKANARAGNTQVLDGNASPAEARAPSEPPAGSPPKEERTALDALDYERSPSGAGKSRIAMSAGAVVLVAVAAIGLRLAGQHGSTAATATTSSLASSPAALVTPETATVDSPVPTASSAAAPEASALTEPTPGAAPAAMPKPVASAAATTPASARTSTAAPAPTAPKVVAPAASASTTPAAPVASTTTAPTTKARKFRTNLD